VLSQSVPLMCHSIMKKLIPFIALFVITTLHSSALAQTHNITAVAMTSPVSAGRYPVNLENTVSATFKNNGSVSDSNIIVTVVIRNPNGVSVYRDTQVVDILTSGQTKEIAFRNFTPTTLGTHQACAITILATDENVSDDTTCSSMLVHYEVDAQAVSVLVPTPDGTIPAKVGFRAKGLFAAPGVRDFYDLKVRMQVRNCSNNSLVIQIDSTIAELLYDDGNVPFEFPSRQGKFDTRNLTPGCYKIAVICTAPDDGNRNDDTAYANFEVVSTTLAHDIKGDSVLTPRNGIQNPTTIPITMRFRNVGANDETDVMVVASVISPKGVVLYRDTATISSLTKGAAEDVTFKTFTFPAQSNYYGSYIFQGASLLATEMFTPDDTIRSSVTLGTAQDVQAVEILDPYKDEVKQGGVGFAVKVTFRTSWGTGEVLNVPVRVLIRECKDNQLRFQADTVIPVLHVDSGLFTVIFPIKSGTFNTASLPAGCYDVRAFHRLSFDGNRSNDTAKSNFTIAPFKAHNITAAAVTSPQDLSHGGKTIAIAVKYKNTGVNDETNVKLIARVTNRDGEEIYRDSMYESNWKSGEERTKGFKNLLLPLDGIYKIYGIASLSGDLSASDDTVISRYSTGQVIDAEAVEVFYPDNGMSFSRGVSFNPIASFRWAGGFDDKYPVPVSLEIRRCDNNMLVFQADSILDSLRVEDDAKEVIFPATWDGWDIANIPDGCYRIAAIAKMEFDGNRKNDTAYSTFYITPLGVNADDKTTTLQLRSYPNPFTENTTIRYLLSEDGYVNLSIRDVNGKLIRKELDNSYSTKGSHSVIINREGTTSGSYFCELTFKAMTGQVHSQTQILIAK
jgi:hypothetical protein